MPSTPEKAPIDRSGGEETPFDGNAHFTLFM